jgi:hypothetical protein
VMIYYVVDMRAQFYNYVEFEVNGVRISGIHLWFQKSKD